MLPVKEIKEIAESRCYIRRLEGREQLFFDFLRLHQDNAYTAVELRKLINESLHSGENKIAYNQAFQIMNRLRIMRVSIRRVLFIGMKKGAIIFKGDR